jgi:hypothetical protein
MERRSLIDLGYSMVLDYITKDGNRTSKTLYIRMILKYKEQEYYREDLFNDDMYMTDRYFDKISLQHFRNKKLEQLGI